MKTFFLLLLFLFSPQISQAKSIDIVPAAKLPTCRQTPIPLISPCSADLTIAIDMSSAMKTAPNVALLTNSVLNDLLMKFDFNDSLVATLPFGASGVDASLYFDNYASVCEYISAAQQQSIQSGLDNYELEKVFLSYNDLMFNSSTTSQKVLLLLTAISDPKNILKAKPLADSIIAHGGKIIVVGIGGNHAVEYQQFGTFYSSAGYTVPQISSIIGDVCVPGHVTVHATPNTTTPFANIQTTPKAPPLSTTTRPAASSPPAISTTTLPSKSTTAAVPVHSSPSAPPHQQSTANPPQPSILTTAAPNHSSSSAAPSPQSTANHQSPVSTAAPPLSPPAGINKCSSNYTNIWLDIQFLIETTDSTYTSDLQALGLELFAAIEGSKINWNNTKASRIGIITYSDDTVTQLEMSKSTKENVSNIFHSLGSFGTHNTEVNLQKAVKLAGDKFDEDETNRAQVLVIAASPYNKWGFEGAIKAAEILKESGISIITINMDYSSGSTADRLKNLSSPGYDYFSNTLYLGKKLRFALTQMNCVCPYGKAQHRVYDAVSNTNTIYANCLWGFSGETPPSMGKDLCYKGALASIPDQSKFDFITSKVVPHDFINATTITVGLHKYSNKDPWKWYGYNGTFDYQGFPQFYSTPNANNLYTYIQRVNESSWQLFAGGDIPRPYVCESKACDADNYCDLTGQDSQRFLVKDIF